MLAETKAAPVKKKRNLKEIIKEKEEKKRQEALERAEERKRQEEVGAACRYFAARYMQYPSKFTQ